MQEPSDLPRLVERNLVMKRGPRPDQAEIAFEHVHELWEFIELQATHEPPHRRDPWVAVD